MLQLMFLLVSADHGLARICGVPRGGGREGRSWGDVSLGDMMVEFTLNRHSSPGDAFGCRESGDGLFPPPSLVSFVFGILVLTLGLMENLCGFKTTETHRFIQSSYEG